jgi:hypothetical protein
MLNKTVAAAALILGVLAAGLYQTARAQESATPKAPAESDKVVNAYRLDFSVNEMEDGKKINTRQYSMNLNANDSNEIKIGSRVPVEAEHEKFQYLDIGTNIGCTLRGHDDNLLLQVRTEISNFAVPMQTVSHEALPVIRQLKINASTVVLLGKTMVMGSVDDPSSKRQFQLEVTVTKLR